MRNAAPANISTYSAGLLGKMDGWSPQSLRNRVAQLRQEQVDLDRGYAAAERELADAVGAVRDALTAESRTTLPAG